MKKKYIKIIIAISLLVVFLVCVWKIFFSDPGVAIEYTGKNNIGFQQDRSQSGVYYVWYPTGDSETTESVIASNAAFYGFSATKDTEILPGIFPVIFLFHGYEGNWKNLSWLAAQLARDGNIVVTQDMQGFSSIDYDINSFLTMDDSFTDINNYINEIILESKWSEYIDDTKVYAGGTSLGGFITSVLGGGSYDFSKMTEYCRDKNTQVCDFMSPVLEDFKEDIINTSQKNSFITKTFLLAPGLMESVDVPQKSQQLIIAAEYDENVDNERLKSFSGTSIEYFELDGVDHFTFLQACRPGAVEVLQKYDGAGKACLNSGSRQDNHKNIFTQIQIFLAK